MRHTHSTWTKLGSLVLVVLLLPASVVAGTAVTQADEMRLSVAGLAAGEVVTQDLVTLTVEPSGFALHPEAMGGPAASGEGHYHVHLDDHLNGVYATTEAIVDLHGSTPGMHTLTVLPATNDHHEIAEGAVVIAFDYQPESGPAPDQQVISVSLSEMSISPSELTLSPGTYTFEAHNDGTIEHALWVVGEGLQAGTPDSSFAGGVTESFSVELAPGTYELVCPVQWHKAQGMVGRLIVTD